MAFHFLFLLHFHTLEVKISEKQFTLTCNFVISNGAYIYMYNVVVFLAFFKDH